MSDPAVEYADALQRDELDYERQKRCGTCIHAGAEGRHGGKPTFEEDGYALCSRVVFNDEPFWEWKTDESGAFVYEPGTRRLIGQRVAPPVAWVVDGSDYWAALHVTPDFGCTEWEAKP